VCVVVVVLLGSPQLKVARSLKAALEADVAERARLEQVAAEAKFDDHHGGDSDDEESKPGGQRGGKTGALSQGGPPSPLAKALKAAGGTDAVLALVAAADAEAAAAAAAGSDDATTRSATCGPVQGPVRDGTLVATQQVWRLIPKDQDTRPAWRVPFDDGKVGHVVLPLKSEDTETPSMLTLFDSRPSGAL
jgi:hypothetical protein